MLILVKQNDTTKLGHGKHSMQGQKRWKTGCMSLKVV